MHYALHNAGAPLESSTPKSDRGGGRGVPLPSQVKAWERCIYKHLSGVRGGAAAENGFGEI